MSELTRTPRTHVLLCQIRAMREYAITNSDEIDLPTLLESIWITYNVLDGERARSAMDAEAS